jgi:hypothetical protein
MIIIFNGPPGSGKDEAAAWMQNRGNFEHLSFKHELYKETIYYFDVPTDWFMERCTDRETKEVPSVLLGHMSCREAMIHVSENVIKPKHGKSYFGEQVTKQVKDGVDYVISDGGFVEEIMPLIDRVGKNDIVLVQLVREGCSYSTDSRRYFNGSPVYDFICGKLSSIEEEYIQDVQLPIKTIRIYNNGTLEQFHSALEEVHGFIKHETVS